MEEKFMKIALEQAKKAAMLGEVPVGAVIVKDDKVLAKAYNIKEKSNLVTKHAEIIAVEKASRKLNNWRLNDCDIYITLEPCPMCASAIKQARISHVYYGLSNKDKNNKTIISSIFNKDLINKSVDVSCGYLSFEIQSIMSDFFNKKRVKK